MSQRYGRWWTSMKELTRFKRWANRHRRGRGLLCHFYEVEGKKQKKYYSKSDYAYFNLFSNSPDWVVKGTIGHGITSREGKTSHVPCLNCYQINDEFYEALDIHLKQGRKKYEFGIIFSKLAVKRHFGEDKVRDIELWDHRDSRPSPAKCWLYDIPKARRSLIPFNYCRVVRIRIPKTRLYGIPIGIIPRKAIMGLLVRRDGYDHSMLSKLLRKKRWEENESFEIFPLL